MKSGNDGFTLVEVMVVSMIIVPLLILVGSTTDTVSRCLDANDRKAESVDTLRRALQRIGPFVRSGSLSTIRFLADEGDVKAGRAVESGEWIEPLDLEPRTAIQFQSADGVLSMKAEDLSQPRSLIFNLDVGEIDNDADDDGDGFVDEGRLQLIYEGTRLTLAEGIAGCTFTMDGRLMRVELRSLRRDKSRRTYQAIVEQVFYIRNN